MGFNRFVIVITTATLLGALSFACGSRESVEELKKAGQKAFLAQDYETAREYFLQGIAQDPSDRDLLYFAGVAYRRDYMYDSALFYLKRLDILHPNDREANLQLYEIALALEDWDYALAALGGLVRTGDRLEDYYPKYAELWAKKDHPANAYYYLKKSIEVNPDVPDFYIRAATLAPLVDPGPAALEILDSAVSRFGNNEAFQNTRAMVLAKQEDYVGAEKIFRSLVEGDTANAMIKINLANVLVSQDSRDKKEEGLAVYRSIVDKVSEQLKIDSLIEALEQELR